MPGFTTKHVVPWYGRQKRGTFKLKVLLGRVMRDLQRKCQIPDVRLAHLLTSAERLFSQRRNDTNKVYSVHASEVECIAKGKTKRYEFGCKVAMVTSSKRNWVLAIDVLHGNPFDGHTLKQSLAQVQRVTGWKPWTPIAIEVIAEPTKRCPTRRCT
jgi:IS5 family transposase